MTDDCGYLENVYQCAGFHEQDDYLAVPEGWEIVPDSQVYHMDDESSSGVNNKLLKSRTSGVYAWGAYYLMLGNGVEYDTNVATGYATTVYGLDTQEAHGVTTYKPSTQSNKVMMRRKLTPNVHIANAAGTVSRSGVVYDGYEYTTMQDDCKQTDSDLEDCPTSYTQDTFLSLPDGWEISPYSDGILENVIQSGEDGQYGWGSEVLVTKEGASYYTDMRSNRLYAANNQLVTKMVRIAGGVAPGGYAPGNGSVYFSICGESSQSLTCKYSTSDTLTPGAAFPGTATFDAAAGLWNCPAWTQRGSGYNIYLIFSSSLTYRTTEDAAIAAGKRSCKWLH